ncbi:hypothetical protein [Paenibacillus sp. ov031]|uniref:hypothetical protein n=1 Tax=Paenibacillus sp. ov031 TaxID=1761879 RepID=UPI001FCDF362|nr:hypothetical protein [Paenibacillus sp. ov031]
MLKAQARFASLVMACTMIFSVVGMVFQPAAKVSAADASGTTASISDILKNQRPDGGWKKDYKKQVVSGPNLQLIIKLHTQKLED